MFFCLDILIFKNWKRFVVNKLEGIIIEKDSNVNIEEASRKFDSENYNISYIKMDVGCFLTEYPGEPFNYERRVLTLSGKVLGYIDINNIKADTTWLTVYDDLTVTPNGVVKFSETTTKYDAKGNKVN